jgi:serine/threonine protein kinase
METISHYRVLKKIGAGGMGEVYLAQDTKLSCDTCSTPPKDWQKLMRRVSCIAICNPTTS